MVEAGNSETEQRPLIAVIDSDATARRALRQALEKISYAVVEYDAPPSGPAATAPLHAMLLAVGARGEEAIEAVKRFGAREPELAVIAIASERTSANVVRQLRQDAWEVVQRPISDELLVSATRRAVDKHRLVARVRKLVAEVDERRSRGLVLGQSPAMRVLMQRMERLLDSHVPVCIFGEAGSGKQTVARALHDMGSRRAGPFITLDCAVTSAANQASEVLGTERGAGGSGRPSGGCFERAHGGTILVDNIADADPATQEAILHVLEHGSVRRVGATRDTAVDVRIVATSTRALGDEVRGRRFNEELYHRLQSESLRVAPLRERREDIPMLVSSFMAQMRRDGGVGAERVSAEAMELLMRHPWSGNVRELQTVVQRAMLASDSREIRREHLPPPLRPSASPLPPPYADGAESFSGGSDGGDQVITLRELERREIMKALSFTGGSVAQAARKLGIGRATLYRRLSELNLPPPTVAMRNAMAARISNGSKVD